MASRKLTALPNATEVTTSDKIYIVDVSDTTESPQGTSKQALISELPSNGITSLTSTDGSISIDNTDPSAPDLSIASPCIPLAGTAEGAPLTGVIEVQSGYLAQWTSGDVVSRVGFNEDGDFFIERKDIVTGAVNFVFISNPSNPQINLVSSDGTKQSQISIGFTGGNTYQFFEAEKIGYFNKANTGDAAPQASPIADATNTTDVITQLNTLLAAMRAYGLIAE